MLTNYLKIAWRNLAKNKTFSIINIAGLGIGLCCFLLIALYVLDELSFDQFYPNADRIFRINCDFKFNGSFAHLPVAPDIMGSTLKKDYPEIEDYSRFFTGSGSKLIKKGNEFISERNLAHTDSSFFNLFRLRIVEGNPNTALIEPNTVAISQSAAIRYFGQQHAIGRTLETNDRGKTIYKITLVYQDIPENAQFRFDFLFSMKNVDYAWGNFLSNNFFTYVLLRPGTDYKSFNRNFQKFVEKYIMPQAQMIMQVKNFEEFEKAGNALDYALVPLTSIHLHSDRDFELRPSGSIQYVYIFGAVAIFILLIACINFMNLSTAKSANRAKEVGIRKVLGTERRGLILQFLFESVLMVIIAMAFAGFLAYLLLPFFNNIAGKSMEISDILHPWVLPGLIALPFVVGILAGSYPAFFLSSFRPVEVIKGQLSSGSRSSLLRSLLVVFQFSTSIVLMIGTMVIYRQLNYIQNKKLGFNKDQVLIVNGAYALNNNLDAFKNEILQEPGVSSGTVSSYLPTPSSRSTYTWSKDPVLNSKNGLSLQVWTIDYDYLKTMGMELQKGRNFSKVFADSNSVIINESVANLLGYTDPLGKKLYAVPRSPTEPFRMMSIIGVVRNFHYESLRENIAPLSLLLGNSAAYICFKVNAGHLPDLVNKVESRWKALAPGMPFSYQFLDESFSSMYRSEQRAGTIALIFSIQAILVACMGLFGLAAFIAEQRTKEIGIRRILGASVHGIVELLSRDFIRLVLIAFIIATPLAWWAMNKWLQDFAFRTEIRWWVFASAGLLATLIAMATISFQSIKVAISNPAKSLRME